MKKYYFLWCVMLLVACQQQTNKERAYLDTSFSADKRAELLLQEMTIEEKIGQMCQYVGDAIQLNSKNADDQVDYELAYGERAELVKQGKIGSFLKVPTYREANELQRLAEQSRLKIPLLISTDAIHGHGMYSDAVTVFPTEIGIAASFDTLVAYNVARYTAREMRASGYHWTFSPNIEVVRDARWGRSGECFGEDPFVVSKMGVAMINGYRGKEGATDKQVVSCAKHFIAGGISYNGLNGAPADVSERTLREVFFPPFQEAIKAGVSTIMPAHNEINGIPCHAHHDYLMNLIRGEWGFNGFFISDWTDIEKLNKVHRVVNTDEEASVLSVNSGVDMHMHGPGFFDHILQAVKDGRISEERIDQAVKPMLKAKFELGLFENCYVTEKYVSENILTKEHIGFSLDAARKSIVLLKNDNNLLPLSKETKKLLVTGSNADHQAILGDWSRVQPDENVVTVYEGLNSKVGERAILVPISSHKNIAVTEIKKAVKQAKKANVAIVVVGENSIRTDGNKTSGENIDRPILGLPGNQLELVRQIKATGVPVVTVLVNGGVIACENLVELSDAILEVWEPGIQGGTAVAEVLFGDYNPGGRMPMSVPRSVGHLQSFYNYKPSAFHRGRFFNSGRTPLFPFGFGLSYTTFEYSRLSYPKSISRTESVSLRVMVKNTGKFIGDEVVLLFLTDEISSVTTPVKKLVGFKRITLKPGEEKELHFEISNQQLQLLNKDFQNVVEPGDFKIELGLNQLHGKFSVMP
ncbi:MAG: glycoside hydrolase family 3 C-terminal domain-containing protein [Carboxylicivirga sp.]|jgi:beta-glucosidase|nr:glycoside hydrolase family 3 C-terminal domain-containing protein [Carboxylicivirga sp.]